MLLFMERWWEEDLLPDRVLSVRAKVRGCPTDGHIELTSVAKGHALCLPLTEDDPDWSLDTEVLLLNIMIFQGDDTKMVKRLDSTKIFELKPGLNYDSYVELCCGMGALSWGPMELGIRPCAAMDISKLAVKVYNLNHEIKALEGNILDGEDVARLFLSMDGRRCGLAAGFPCPPFSARGDAKGYDDPRALVFIQTLNVAYAFGSIFLVLECTPNTGKWGTTHDLLRSFSNAMGMDYQMGILHLQRTWACNRSRWWVTMARIGALQPRLPLCDLPKHPELTRVCDVIPELPLWPQADRRGLEWDEYEQRQYGEIVTADEILLSMTSACPTLLHSCGHHWYPCPCGCRANGLSRERLLRDGVSTVALRSEDSERLRHLHPQEAAFLCTIWPTLKIPEGDIRATLPLIGQLAAPLQSHWVFGQLFECLAKADIYHCDGVLHDSLQRHRSFLDKLLRLRYHCWAVHSMGFDRALLLHSDDGSVLTIKIGPFATVGQLLHAERELQGWGARVKIYSGSMVLESDWWLHGGSYGITCYTPKSIRAPSSEPLTVIVHKDSLCQQSIVPPGAIVSQVLAPLGIQYERGSLTDNGSLHWGDRIWHNTILRLRGAGVDASLPGIAIQDMINEVESLITQVDDTDFHLIPLDWLADLLMKPRVVAGFQLKSHLYNLISSFKALPSKIIGIICHDGHWSMVTFCLFQHITVAFDSLPDRHACIVSFLGGVFQEVFGSGPPPYPSRTLLTQRNDDLCGVHTLINFGWQLHLWDDFDYIQAQDWHNSITQSNHHRGAGATDYASAHAALVALLPEKGVPHERAAERAALALKRLGTPAIAKALNADRPWQQLKALGSSNSKPFQWVSPDELKAHIGERAASKFGASSQGHKRKAPRGKDQRRPPLLDLPVDKLVLPQAAFVDESKNPLSQIGGAFVKADSKGVAIVTVEQARRFIIDNKSISPDPLGLLTVVELQGPFPGDLLVENITWPALFEDDPLLVKGSLLQLGDQHVQLNSGPVAIPALTTSLMRLQIYRDQWPQPWDAFVKGPLRQVAAQFAPLQICNTTGCGAHCPRFHPAIEEACDLVLLDCFSWRWFNDDGAPVPPPKAASFSVMVRTPHSAVDGILSISGKEGFFPELREDDATPSKYAVIWLKKTHGEVSHLLQVQPLALHLTRLHRKFGLRCLRKNEAALRKILFPDQAYVDCEIKLIFCAGPFPHGAMKNQIQESIHSLSWAAKVLKPQRGGPDGRYWTIGAATPPPTVVFQFGDSHVTIDKLKEMSSHKQQTNVVASLQTIQRLQGQTASSSAVDPWLQKDPWSQWQGNQAPAAPSSSTTTRLEEIETRLKTSLTEQLKEQFTAWNDQSEEAMEDVDDSRMNKFQTDLTELKEQSQQFHMWFQQAGDRMNQMQTTITQQGTTLETITQTVQTHAQNFQGLHQSMGNMEANLRQDLRDALAQQTEGMGRLEAMLAKKFRSGE